MAPIDNATHPHPARPRVLSGMQPSGDFQLGNYIGALKQWVLGQSEKENFFCIVDLHSLTVQQDPEDLRQRTRAFAAIYIAAGIDPELSTLFIQSHVTAHAEAGWLLECVTPLGWLEKMTQFKDKSRKQSPEAFVADLLAGSRAEVMEFLKQMREATRALNDAGELGDEEITAAMLSTLRFQEDTLNPRRDSVSTGILVYPALMAADILLYDADEVPVGDDQKQHVELTRNIAERFNHLYGHTFVVPKPMIPKVGARVMGLDNPSIKMSKSLGHIRGHAVRLLDEPAEIEYVFKRAVTDSFGEIRFSDDPARAGVNNLLSIYKVLTGRSVEEVEADFATARGYGDLKKRVAEVVIEEFAPIRERYNQLMRDPGELDRLLAHGAARAAVLADAKLEDMKEKMGLVRKIGERK